MTWNPTYNPGDGGIALARHDRGGQAVIGDDQLAQTAARPGAEQADVELPPTSVAKMSVSDFWRLTSARCPTNARVDGSFRHLAGCLFGSLPAALQISVRDSI